MITFEEARAIAQAVINKGSIECQIIDSATNEKPYGWCFHYQSKRFLETRKFSHSLVGNAPILVERETGRAIVLGTSRNTAYYLAAYEAGFCDHHDLTIFTISDLPETIRLLRQLGVTIGDQADRARQYQKDFEQAVANLPQSSDGITVMMEHARIVNEGHYNQMEDALGRLPYTFKNQFFIQTHERFAELDRAGCCTYQLTRCKE